MASGGFLHKKWLKKLEALAALGPASVPAGGTEKTGWEGISLRGLIGGTLSAVLGFLLGSCGVIFSSYPFGIAYLSVVSRHVPWVWMGLIFASLFSRGMALASAILYTGIFLLRWAISRHLMRDTPGAALFGENLLLRCSISCFSAFVFGLYRLIGGGFLYYDLFGLLAGFLFCPTLSFALSGLYLGSADQNKTGEAVGRVSHGSLAAFLISERFAQLSAAVLMFITVYSLRDVTLLGFAPALLAAVLLALMAASQGALGGCAVGLLAGIAAGVPIAVICASVGLCCGLLWQFSHPAAVASACAAGLILGAAMDGFDALPALMPEILGAAVIFLPLSRYGFLPALPFFAVPAGNMSGEEAWLIARRQEDTIRRRKALSHALTGLSQVIRSLSGHMRKPGIPDIRQICDGAFDAYCSRCSLSRLCLERECTSTLDAQGKIAAALYQKGRIDEEDIPAYFRERCYNLTKILARIDLDAAGLAERLITGDKTDCFAGDYEALSRMLTEEAERSDEEYRMDGALAEKLRRTLRYMDIPAARVLCFGKRRLQIAIGGVELSRMRFGADELRRALEHAAGIRLTQPHFRIDEGNVTVFTNAARTIKTECAQAGGMKEHEKANGDTAVLFDGPEDVFYALLSDGMGSGREAAVTSRLCTVFIERMLSGGAGTAVTLEMLNGLIRGRNTECSATVDLVEIDRISGKACFVKSGAAPSWVLRAGNLYKLQSNTMPIGILAEPDAEQIRFDLLAGDIILLMSDGVAQSLEDGVWLANLLTFEWEDDLEAMAEKIIENARLNNKRSDDMTAVLIRVSEEAGEG